MKLFYKTITIFSQDGDSHLKSEVIHCFRCIVNGGKDPVVLRADLTTWKSKTQKVQITDIKFIQSLIRDSSVIEFISTELLDSVKTFEERNRDFENSKLSYSQKLSQRSPQKLTQKQSLRETLLEYGIPSSEFDNQEMSEEEKSITSTEYLITDEQQKLIFKTQKSDVLCSVQLSEDLIELCSDLSVDIKSAEIMCSMKLCDGVINFMKYIFEINLKDRRVSTTIELLWTLLDSYLNQTNMALEKNKIVTVETDIGNMGIDDCIDLMEVLDIESAVFVLHYMITSYAHEGVRGKDKENRNEVLVILSLIAESPSSHIYFIGE